MASRTVCNMCGKTFDIWDTQEDFSLHREVGYGSKYDGSVINLDLCCECMDKLIDNISKKCAISPIEKK